MRRRALLTSMAVGAAGLAGCISGSIADGDDANDSDSGGNGSDGGGDGSDPDDDGNSAAPGGDGGNGDGTGDTLPEPPDGRSSVIDLETIGRTYAYEPISFHTDDDARVALWFDRTATDESPARLTGWLRNENGHENTFDLEWIPAVGRTHSHTLSGYDHTSRLHLAPTENNDVAESIPEVEQNDDGLWHVTDVGPWIQDTVRLDPGESVQLEYRLVGEPNLPGRPTGTYEFRGDDETVRIAVWDTDSPGPEADSRFEGRDLPPLHDGAAGDEGEQPTVQWYHEADASTPAYLEPARETLELDGTIDFELVFNARDSTGCGHWNVHKLVDGEWVPVGPLVHTSDCRAIAPGARMDWTLRAFNGPAVACDCEGEIGCGDGFTRGYLGPGVYGVVSGYGHPADECGALVELEGEPVAIEPTDDATIERDGVTVVVTTGAYDDGEHPADATLIVERTDADGDGGNGGNGDGEEPDRVVAEQLYGGQSLFGRSSALRNAIAGFEDGVERVEVRTDEYDVESAVGRDRSTRRVAFRGTIYELTAAFDEG